MPPIFPVHADELQESEEQPIPIASPRSRVTIGERLSFHGRWFGIPVGSGWIEVREQMMLNGHTVYSIATEGHSNSILSTFYPIRDIIHCYIDAQTLQPLQVEKHQREGHYRAEEIVTFDYQRLVATYRSLVNQSSKEISIPPAVHDIISAFYWLRTHPVDFTQPIIMSIYSDEKVYRTEIQPLRMLMVELLWRGTFPCVLIEPKATFAGILVRRGRIWLYLSTDERRLPLFVKVSTPWGPMTAVIDPECLKGAPLPPRPTLTR